MIIVLGCPESCWTTWASVFHHLQKGHREGCGQPICLQRPTWCRTVAFHRHIGAFTSLTSNNYLIHLHSHAIMMSNRKPRFFGRENPAQKGWCPVTSLNLRFYHHSFCLERCLVLPVVGCDLRLHPVPHLKDSWKLAISRRMGFQMGIPAKGPWRKAQVHVGFSWWCPNLEKSPSIFEGMRYRDDIYLDIIWQMLQRKGIRFPYPQPPACFNSFPTECPAEFLSSTGFSH